MEGVSESGHGLYTLSLSFAVSQTRTARTRDYSGVLPPQADSSSRGIPG